MRRDRTWKICANHYSELVYNFLNKSILLLHFFTIVTPTMKLKPNCDSDRAWVWSVSADFADETPKPELLAVRFANSESQSEPTIARFLFITLVF